MIRPRSLFGFLLGRHVATEHEISSFDDVKHGAS